MKSKVINRVVRKGVLALKKNKEDSKELKRFVDIYKTVYRHARKKGQNHSAAMSYCWNVYSDQASKTAMMIIKSVVSGGTKMKSEGKHLRKLILKEMIEGEIIKLSDFQKDQEPEIIASGSPFEAFLSEMHHQMTEFMDEEFDNMTPEQLNFLDEILDSVEDLLGIEEEGIDFAGDEDEDL